MHFSGDKGIPNNHKKLSLFAFGCMGVPRVIKSSK